MDIKNRFFRFHGFRNNRISDEPVGFWFMWKPQHPKDVPEKKFDRLMQPMNFLWIFDFAIGWYAPYLRATFSFEPDPTGHLSYTERAHG